MGTDYLGINSQSSSVPFIPRDGGNQDVPVRQAKHILAQGRVCRRVLAFGKLPENFGSGHKTMPLARCGCVVSRAISIMHRHLLLGAC